MTTILPWLAVLAGFIVLIWSAERFIEGSAAIANNAGVPKLLIGLTIVAFGTSAPEVVVSISSSLKAAGELAIGNAIGSNIANVGLVLGVTALLAPIPVKSHILKQEVPIMLGVMGIAGWFFFDGNLLRHEGIILVLLIIPLMFWLAYSKKQHPEEEDDFEEMKTWLAALWFVIGLSLLIVSAEILVWGATSIALDLGISQLVIGLTVVAIGTSLPELAASVISALKGHHDIALGNIIGSNIFNLLLVAGIPGIIAPLTIGNEVFDRDYLFMFGITLVLCVLMLRGFIADTTATLGRWSGFLLLALYAGYYALLF